MVGELAQYRKLLLEVMPIFWRRQPRILLPGVLLCTLVLTASAAMASRAEAPERGEVVFERVVLLPVGPAPDQLGYSDMEQLGPEAFWILPDGVIRVLDTVKGRIADFRDGVFEREIDLPEALYARDMVVADELTYVLAEGEESYVLVIDGRGAIIRSVVVPRERAYMVHCLQPTLAGEPLVAGIDGLASELTAAPGACALVGRYGQAFGLELSYLPSGALARISRDCLVIELQGRRDLKEVTVWNVDRDGALYLSYLDLADTSRVAGDLVVGKYSRHGAAEGIAALSQEGLWSWPARWLHVTSDGEIYWLRPLAEGVAVDRVHLGRFYVSQIEELEKEWHAERQQQLESLSPSVMSIPPDISREEVNSNCDRNINYSWTYNSYNASPVPRTRRP